MSRILWKLALQPPLDEVPQCYRYDLYDGDMCVPRAAIFPEQDDQLVQLPDPRAYRSLGRTGLLLMAAGLRSRKSLAPLIERDPFSVGIYCALEHGPNDFNSAKQMIDTPVEEFAATYKSLRSPKQYLKQLPNVPASQLAICLGIMGPLYLYQHSHFACLHALDQAEFDLNAGTVEAALVCAAFSLEDPLLSMRASRSVPKSMVLSEGAAALVLTPDGEYTCWRALLPPYTNCFFGIAQDLVMLARSDSNDSSLSELIAGCREGNSVSIRPAAPSSAGEGAYR
ncbi:MAG TPA: hypothetical protein VKY85_11935 [Candidatus Angelobacter sp.]|nr:hypothetical protein [Candidatus Angelobacter sp.]